MKSNVVMYTVTQGRGDIVTMKERHACCSFCFNEFPLKSRVVSFRTSDQAFLCHKECEIPLRERIEKRYWENHEKQKIEDAEVKRILDADKTMKKERGPRAF